MTQTPIPYLFLRGGSSRGPYFNRADLPADRDRLARVLMAAGAGGAALPNWQMLARAFRNEGVDTCFALLGDANMNCATAMADLGTRMVHVRHEHSAVAAAMAWAHKTGGVGVATVTCGPGLTQILTAQPAAVRARLPLVILAGEALLKSGWHNQAIDQAPFITAAGARYIPMHHIPRMAEAVRDAFLQARMTRVPVVLGVPFDLQDQPPPAWPARAASW